MKHYTIGFVTLIVCVDDLRIIGPNDDEIATLKHFLDCKFTIKDLGFAKYFLGMKLTRGTDGLSLNQRKYILDILTDFGLLVANLLVLLFLQF